MNRQPWICYALVCATLLLMADVTSAQRRRRRANYNYNYNNNYYYNTYSAPAPQQQGTEVPYLSAVYSYDRGKKPEVAFEDKIQVFLRVNDSKVLESDKPIVAEVKLRDLRDAENTSVQFIPVQIDRDEEGEYKTAVLNVSNEKGKDPVIQSARVYRMHVKLHEKSDKYSDESALGRMSLPYYVATTGESRLEKARQQIAMRTFREWYYAKQGWQTDEYYVMDCYAYYMWATGFCTKGATNGQTNLWQLFNNETPFHSGGDIAALAEKNPIHGDYVRIPGHSFMLLAYDVENNQVWTMEGNYGATIEIVTRYVQPGWTVGHLLESHIRSDAFKLAKSDEEKSEMGAE